MAKREKAVETPKSLPLHETEPGYYDGEGNFVACPEWRQEARGQVGTEETEGGEQEEPSSEEKPEEN